MLSIEKDEIIKEINRIFSCDLLSNSREMKNVNGRRAFCFYLRKEKKMTYEAISFLLEKNHATVMHHEKQHKSLICYDKEYRDNYNTFIATIRPKKKSWLCKEVKFNIQKCTNK